MTDDTSPIRFDPRKQGYYRDDSKTKPTGSAGAKDFKKIASKDGRDGKSSSSKRQIEDDDDAIEEQADEIAMADGEEDSQDEAMSLFDMSKALSTKTQPQIGSEKGFNAVADGKKGMPSPASIMGGNKPKSTDNSSDVEDVTTDSEHIGEALELHKKTISPARPFDLLAGTQNKQAQIDKTLAQKGKSASQSIRDQQDTSTINLMAVGQQGTEISMNLDMKAQSPLPPVKSMQELINLMVKEAQSMEAEGKTDTTVTLKYPPIFEGAQLIVTSFDSARGEFNISFENLTAAAQQLISMRENKESLLHALEQKGYHVHIVTASTIDEQRLFTAHVEDNPRERQNREDQEQQGNKQQREREDEGEEQG